MSDQETGTRSPEAMKRRGGHRTWRGNEPPKPDRGQYRGPKGHAATVGSESNPFKRGAKQLTVRKVKRR